MDTYLDAHENYQKAGSHNLAADCFNQAQLMSLQIDDPQTLVLHIASIEVKKLMTYGDDFKRAFVLANAYNLNLIEEWMEPLYYQVIISGNMQFFCEFAGAVPFSNALYSEMVRKWKINTANQRTKTKSDVANLHVFLSYLSDKFLLYQLVQDLGKEFRDDLKEHESLPGILQAKLISPKPVGKGAPLPVGSGVPGNLLERLADGRPSDDPSLPST